MAEYFAYPAWRYHAELPPKLVEDDAEDAALGEGWFDNPLLKVAEKPEPTDPAEIKAVWVEVGELFGMTVDKRWKLAKVQDEVRSHVTDLADEFARMKKMLDKPSAVEAGRANVA